MPPSTFGTAGVGPAIRAVLPVAREKRGRIRRIIRRYRGGRRTAAGRQIRDWGGHAVRYVYVGLIVVFTALVLLFKFQNLETVTVSLFSSSITLPVSVLVVGIYALGMLTGGFVLALLRSWIGGARGRR
jgi:lipopolysaccharide assembly protein A